MTKKKDKRRYFAYVQRCFLEAYPRPTSKITIRKKTYIYVCHFSAVLWFMSIYGVSIVIGLCTLNIQICTLNICMYTEYANMYTEYLYVHWIFVCTLNIKILFSSVKSLFIEKFQKLWYSGIFFFFFLNSDGLCRFYA